MKVRYGNSYSQVVDMDTATHTRLKRLLRYQVDAAGVYAGRPPRYAYLIDKKGYFPTGLINRVLNELGCSLEDGRTDQAKYPYRASFNPNWVDTPYKAQEEAVAWGAVHHRGTISMPTGTGKSRVIAMLIDSFKTPTLIIVPSLEIKKQLREGLKAVFGSLKHITVENVDSKALKTPGEFGMLIIDEAHHVAASTYQKLNKTSWANIPHRFFLTATPFRNNDDEQLLFEGIAGEVIYKLSYKEAISKGYICPVEAYYLEVPKQATDAYTWQQVYSELVVNHPIRNLMIAEVALQLAEERKSTLVLVKEIKHGEALQELTGLPFANGQAEDCSELIRQFNTGEIPVLIGTEGVLGEGVDTKPCEYVVIAALGKAKSAFMQKVGRAVRRYPGKESAKVILFLDKSHKFCKKHFQEQIKILEFEYGIKPTKLER